MQISVAALKALLRLDPETGDLYWRRRDVAWFSDGGQTAEHSCAIWNARFADTKAFTSRYSNGYRRGSVLGEDFSAHRVIFAITHGHWPEAQVDHIDGDITNNRPANLRAATNQENNRNSAHKGGSSNFKGVSWHKRAKKWTVQCYDAEGSSRYLGLFTEEGAAARAYDAFAREHHGEFARLNFGEAA